MKPLKISIITVTYQAAAILEKTIQSVIFQKKNDLLELEYWIIDGGSTDGTLDMIQKYQSHLTGWISEKDKGIYHAMNKGISNASGDWIGFMNAGDRFEDLEVLYNLFTQVRPDAEVIYGNYHIEYQSFAKPKSVPADLSNFWQGMLLNHQSVFIKTELAKKYPFDLTYRLAGDYAQLYNLYMKGRIFQYVDIFVARFADGGESAKRKITYIREIEDIVFKNEAPVLTKRIHFILTRTKVRLTAWLNRCLPAAAFEKLMRLKHRLIGY